jgi:hypothetical protein
VPFEQTKIRFETVNPEWIGPVKLSRTVTFVLVLDRVAIGGPGGALKGERGPLFSVLEDAVIVSAFVIGPRYETPHTIAGLVDAIK